jgi:uncharacterized protein
VLILLPPSEGKAPTRPGRPFDPRALSFPDLTPTREAVRTELTALCQGPTEAALTCLGLSQGQVSEVERNRALPTAGARPAGEIYTGVLYDALDLATLPDAARGRATDSLVIVSGLWGALRVTDRIPPYRLSITARLPGSAPLATRWRRPLAALLPRLGHYGLILDLRSTAYVQAWRPGGDLAERVATVRVLRASTRAVVSHVNKAGKGRFVRDLLSHPERPATPKELHTLAGDLGYATELSAPRRPGRTWTLDLLLEL